jgi:hypothetical protein
MTLITASLLLITIGLTFELVQRPHRSKIPSGKKSTEFEPSEKCQIQQLPRGYC